MPLPLLLLIMALLMPASLIMAAVAYEYGPPGWLAIGLVLCALAAAAIRHDQRRMRAWGELPSGQAESNGVPELIRAVAVDVGGVLAGLIFLLLIVLLIFWVAHFVPNLKPIQTHH